MHLNKGPGLYEMLVREQPGATGTVDLRRRGQPRGSVTADGQRD